MGVGAGRRAHVEGVVLVLDRHDDAVQRADERAGPRELPILRRRGLERVGHVRGAVGRVGQAARLARIEAPRRASRRPQVQRRQRVDLPGVRNRRDRSEDALRLVDARAVVGLDALQIQLDEAARGDLLLAESPAGCCAMVAS